MREILMGLLAAMFVVVSLPLGVVWAVLKMADMWAAYILHFLNETVELRDLRKRREENSSTHA